MKAIEILVDEHDLIMRGLDLLTAAAEKIVRGQNPPREFFEKATEFTFNFTNKYHHYKEEIVMFRQLAQKHEGKIDAEIKRLRSEHDTLHSLMNEISYSLNAYAEGQDSEVRRLHRNLCEYIDTLNHHVTAENKIFYPLAAKYLSDAEKTALMAEFDRAGAEEPEAMKKYGAIIDDMEDLLG